MIPDFTRLPEGADFYIVRHGQSEANRDNVIQGRHNTPLSTQGQKQAEQVGKWFAGSTLDGHHAVHEPRMIDAVFASPLDRAYETASIIARTAGFAAPHRDERIQELDTGLFSGLSLEQIRIKYPEEWSRFQAQSWEAVPQAESVSSLKKRAVSFWNSLIEGAREGKRSVLVVSHGGMIQWLIKVTLGSESWMPIFSASNCGIFHLVVRRSDSLEDSHYREWRLMNHRPSV